MIRFTSKSIAITRPDFIGGSSSQASNKPTHWWKTMDEDDIDVLDNELFADEEDVPDLEADDVEEGEEDDEDEEEDDVSESEEDVDDEEAVEEDKVDFDVDDALDVEELEAEEVDDVDHDDEDGVLDLHDLYGTTTEDHTYQKKNGRAKRYCKNSKDVKERAKIVLPALTMADREAVLQTVTTVNNAKQFSTFELDPKALYQLAGKFMQKSYPFATLWHETSKQTPHWETQTFAAEQFAEKQRIDVMTAKLSVSEGLYQCTKCHSKKTYSRQVQTRSADEGMTTIIQCVNCSKVWREYA